MISNADFIKLPHTPDLTESGIAFATRSLARSLDFQNRSIHSRLVRIVSEVCVELAFRRYLNETQTPFQVRGALPFSEPDQYDVNLGGHRCDMHTFLISKRKQISTLRNEPALLLNTPALLREDEFSSTSHNENDLHIFAFLLGLTTNSHEDLWKVVEKNRPIFLIHPFRPDWSHPKFWSPLGKLSLKSECSSPVRVEIGGLDCDRNFISETMTLEPLVRVYAQNDFYSMAYIHIDGLPNARLGLHSANKSGIYLVQTHEWSNIWIYGLEIWLTGYLTQGEFRRKANTSFSGSRVFQYSKTQTKNLSVPVSDLQPLQNLFEKVKKWEAEKKLR
jgi:hypothetical protein